jgi:hypothetical protein
MDDPSKGRRGEARHVGIRDMETGEVKVIMLPATCWHILPLPSEELFYAISFRVAPTDRVDFHEWSLAYLKEYVFEIDAERGVVRRHWATGRETPAHVNSDIAISDSELIFCNGGSQSILFLPWRAAPGRWQPRSMMCWPAATSSGTRSTSSGRSG